MLIVKEPVCVVGDIHGQYNDLINMMKKLGDPDAEKLNYLFLGDYVDRGEEGIEVCIFLFALKINFPQEMNLLRGNHESRSMTEDFTFREEVLNKFDQEVYELFMDTFDQLPIAAHVNGKYLCVHGGISPELSKIAEINLIDRKREIPMEGMLCDLVWSDPMEE